MKRGKLPLWRLFLQVTFCRIEPGAKAGIGEISLMNS
jgi:hypothetical protein